MRLGNVMGAIIMLFAALLLDYLFIETFYDFINNNMTGESQVIGMVATAILFGFITLAVPIMVAVQDDKTD